MRPDEMPAATNVVPLLRYRDPAAAIDWLCNAFGFEQHFIVRGEGGVIRYAQLTSGAGMIMLGPVSDSEFDKLFAQPDEIGGVETQSCYVATSDLEAHCERAKSHGAQIVFDLQDGPHGAMGYSCRDLEGHIWNFGSYDPWRDKRMPLAARGGEPSGGRKGRRGLARELSVLGLCVAALAVSVSVLTERGIIDLPIERLASYLPEAAGGMIQGGHGSVPNGGDAVARVIEQEGELTQLETAVARARVELADAISQKERIELVLKDMTKESRETAQGAEEFRQGAVAASKEKAEALKLAEETRQQLDAVQQEKERADRLAQNLQSELDKEREQRVVWERSQDELKLRLADEAKARETAERALQSAQSEETAAKQKLALAEEALNKVQAKADAGPGLTPVTPVETAKIEDGTKVQAWSLSGDETAQPDARKKKAARVRKQRSQGASFAKKKPAVEIEIPSASFPSPQY